MKKKLRKILIISGAFAASIIFLTIIYVQTVMRETADVKDRETIEIEPGTSISGALEKINKKNGLNPIWFFKLWGKIYSRVTGEKIFAGIFIINPGDSNSDIFYGLFKKAEDDVFLVTLPEGYSMRIYASILQKKAHIDSAEFMALARNDSILKKYEIDGKDAEGYLMPNTYEFYRGNEKSAILKLLNENFGIWNSKRRARLNELRMTRHQVMTLASIIEAETPVKSEAPKVSGVYHNRLRIGMPLQADPTVQYAMGARKRLSYKDLSYDNPYNTYKYKGLPPGPINNPGLNAIDAALYPEKNNYIYFVAKGDSSGEHNFSANKSEHDKNVRSYRKSRQKEADVLLK